jgi:hypothetical protein
MLLVNHPDTCVPKIVNNAFQFACTLSTMNPLKFGLGDVCLTIVSSNFVHMIYCISMFSNYMLQTTMVMIF